MDKKARGTRTGFTTGANAAAAARAAMLGILQGDVPSCVETLLPNGQRVVFAVHQGSCSGQTARAECIKDAGDDPDCTHGAHLVAVVEVTSIQGEIELLGGEGIGTVTMPGLGLEVGSAAINPVPRRNIRENIREVAGEWLQQHGLRITLSVPGGEEMAKKTLNERLGIVGGISILGTTGIVHPYSTAAFRASVVQGIEVAARQGQDTVVLTTGGRTEKFVIHELPHLDQACFVQMGDFLTPALDTCRRVGIRHVIIGGMVGKLTKMAQGEVITHARRGAVDTALLAEIAQQAGADETTCRAIAEAETARFAAEQMDAAGLAPAFYRALAGRVVHTLQARYPDDFDLRVMICDFSGHRLY